MSMYAILFEIIYPALAGINSKRKVESPFIEVGQTATIFYFIFFILLIPVVGTFEKKLLRFCVQ